MSDDENFDRLDDSDEQGDEDLPFHLPKADADDDNIHKEDTDEIEIPEGDLYESEFYTVKRQSTEDIAAQHASDPPLDRGRPEDDSVLMQADDDDDMQATMRHDSDETNYDEDVPFRLPQSDDDDSEHGEVPQKWVTMPSTPRDKAETLAGSGGLDPNPDFANMQPTVPQATMPARHQPYQRPQQSVAQPRQHGAPPPAPPARAVPASKPLPKRKKRRIRPGCLAIFIGVFLTFCGGLTLVTLIAGGFAYARVGDLLNKRIDDIDRYTQFQSTFLYDRNGVQLYEVFNEGRRTQVHLDELPQSLIDATLAIEDDSFYSNVGIDIPATTVAFLQFVGAEDNEETAGGSTITQQLVRNVLFDPEYRAERSPQRKVEEILLAIALTGRKSKDEILELYLNEIYYGNLAYGAQAAAQTFFGKDVGELTLGESAMLAGLPQAPADLDPLNPDPSVQAKVSDRWRQVLNEMVQDGSITDAERNQALSDGLSFSSPDVPLRAPHFTVFAQGELEDLMLRLGYSLEEIARGGFHVYTTVDLELNATTQQIARDQVARLAANNVSNAAVIVLKPLTGEVMAMVGSIDYNNDAIDGRVNVTTALRQPGSAMKPFTYSAFLERGGTPGDVIWDTRTEIGIPGQQPYIPRNYDGSFHGPMRMRYALANSFNIPAVQTLRQVGVDYLLSMMQRVGATSLGTDASLYGLSLTLGGGEISPLELTRAYSVLANQGVLVDTHAILCILDNDDNIIYQYENGCPHGNVTSETVAETGLGTQVLDPRIAFIISDILGDNQARSAAMGGNSALYTPNIASSVKTGTTNDVKDNWTVGYTRNVAIGVWAGNNNGDPMINSSGLTGAAPIWNSVLNTIYGNVTLLNKFAVDGQLLPDQLQEPPGVQLRQLCDVRTLTDPATGCVSRINEWFLTSPAGLPDGQGGLDYPPAQNPPQQFAPPNGSYVQEAEPGIFRTAVFPLAPQISASIQFTLSAGEKQPPPPIYCRVPVELIPSTPGVQEQYFIAPPPVQSDAVEAEEYSRARGLAFLPTIDCTPELLTSPQFGPAIMTAVINQPVPNQVVSGSMPIIGTAQFTPQQAQFYGLEIIGGQWEHWTPIGELHYNPVVNGQLEILPVLPPGSYRLRLVIVGLDANIAQQPFEIPFSVQ